MSTDDQSTVSDPIIGTLNESPLHASLKTLVAEPGDAFEQPVSRFVVDILRGNDIIEIQTRSLGKMRNKLVALLPSHRVHVIHPIAHEFWIIKKQGDKVHSRRKSSKRRGLDSAWEELVSIPDLLNDANLTLELVLTQQEEVRRVDKRRRRNWRVEEHRLIDVIDRIIINSPQDLLRLIPGTLPAQFTTADITKVSSWRTNVSQMAAYCLRKSGAADVIGKQGNVKVYQLN